MIEIKSELASIDATLRKLDEKVRLAPAIVRQFAWRPTSAGRQGVGRARRERIRLATD